VLVCNVKAEPVILSFEDSSDIKSDSTVSPSVELPTRDMAASSTAPLVNGVAHGDKGTSPAPTETVLGAAALGLATQVTVRSLRLCRNPIIY